MPTFTISWPYFFTSRRSTQQNLLTKNITKHVQNMKVIEDKQFDYILITNFNTFDSGIH